jgi:hypothetical protein
LTTLQGSRAFVSLSLLQLSYRSASCGDNTSLMLSAAGRLLYSGHCRSRDVITAVDSCLISTIYDPSSIFIFEALIACKCSSTRAYHQEHPEDVAPQTSFSRGIIRLKWIELSSPLTGVEVRLKPSILHPMRHRQVSSASVCLLPPH